MYHSSFVHCRLSSFTTHVITYHVSLVANSAQIWQHPWHSSNVITDGFIQTVSCHGTQIRSVFSTSTLLNSFVHDTSKGKQDNRAHTYRYVIVFKFSFRVSCPSVLVTFFFPDWCRRYGYLVQMLTSPPSIVTWWFLNHSKLGGSYVGNMPSVQHSTNQIFSLLSVTTGSIREYLHVDASCQGSMG